MGWRWVKYRVKYLMATVYRSHLRNWRDRHGSDGNRDWCGVSAIGSDRIGDGPGPGCQRADRSGIDDPRRGNQGNSGDKIRSREWYSVHE